MMSFIQDGKGSQLNLDDGDRLIKRGLVERKKNYDLVLTDEGRAALRRWGG